MAIVTVFAGGKKYSLGCEPGTVIKDVLNGAGIYADAPCGGNGKCGKCFVKAQGELSAPSPEEESLLAGRDGRLSCMAKAEGDCVITVGNGERGMSVWTDGCAEDELFSPKNRTGLGAAVDIGTTTVVCYLFDMDTGGELGALGRLNLQRSFGADVISRIGACVGAPETRRKLSGAVTGQIREMLSELSRNAGRAPEEIHTLVAAGNTTMCHLFAGLDPSGLAAVPFTPESLFGKSFVPEIPELGLAEDAEIYILPAASGFVGGDITAAVIASGMDRSGDTALLIDIGTNGEIVLSRGGELFCCATAAGPAFEGADISCGMGSLDGAVRAVRVRNGRPVCEVIGNKAAAGICGSGLVDALAAMLELGAVDETGRMLSLDEAEEELAGLLGEDENEEPFFRLSEKVFVSSRDVRKLQLAKAAVSAGVKTLLDRAGIGVGDVKTMYIAGGFGSSIDPVNAGKIGLFPAELSEKAVSLGNAAGAGASAVLKNAGNIPRAEELGKRLSYIELSSDPSFMEHYVNEMLFSSDE